MTHPGLVEPDHLRDLLGDWTRPGTMVTVALADSVARLITQGVLPVGSRLPSSVALSRSLRLSRPTVNDAYDLLSVQGLLDKRSRLIAGGPATRDPR